MIGGTTRALIRRSVRGRMDAAMFAWQSSVQLRKFPDFTVADPEEHWPLAIAIGKA